MTEAIRTPVNTAISLLTRFKSKKLTLDEGVTVEVRSLSLGQLEELQEVARSVADGEDQLAQLLPVLQAGIVGLENVTKEQARGFLLEDLQKMSEAVMSVGKPA